ncbi:MAG: hypothetical protein MUF15_08110 [Acidobacteria bacterium]|jgi:anion-transporting  ArsA/GET3 family ATPase|nr:hypothetical protein [Acidobacteriota bacterium]
MNTTNSTKNSEQELKDVFERLFVTNLFSKTSGLFEEKVDHLKKVFTNGTDDILFKADKISGLCGSFNDKLETTAEDIQSIQNLLKKIKTEEIQPLQNMMDNIKQSIGDNNSQTVKEFESKIKLFSEDFTKSFGELKQNLTSLSTDTQERNKMIVQELNAKNNFLFDKITGTFNELNSILTNFSTGIIESTSKSFREELKKRNDLFEAELVQKVEDIKNIGKWRAILNIIISTIILILMLT